MKIKTIICSVLTIGLLAGGLTTTVLAKEDLAAKAKITKAQAQKTIQKLWKKGKIQQCELEEENGKLIWSFDVAMPGEKDIIEAQVDAVTGKVISVAIETPAEQAKEAKADAKEAKGKKQIKKADKEEDEDRDVNPAKKEGKSKKQIKKADKEEEDDKDAKDSKKEGKEKKEIKESKKGEKKDKKENKKDKEEEEDDDKK